MATAQKGQDRARCLAVSLCGAALIATASSAQVIRSDFYVTDGDVNAEVLSGSTLYIGGTFTQVGPATGGGVPIDAAGHPVASFARVAGNVYAVAPDGQGGRYIGGDFIAVGQIPRKNLAHILADQTVSPWDPGANGPVRALAVGPTAVYVGGVFTSVGGQNRNHAAALDPTTGLATAWDPNVSDLVIGIAVSGSTVYLGGSFTAVGGQPRN